MKKKLAKYLANYLEHEIGETDKDGLTVYYENILEQGLEAFESTESVVILITDEKNNLLEAANEILSDFNHYGEVLQVGNNGEYGLESTIGRLTTAIVNVEKRV